MNNFGKKILSLLLNVNYDKSLPEIDFEVFKYGENFTVLLNQRGEKLAKFFVWSVIELKPDKKKAAIIPYQDWIDSEKIKYIPEPSNIIITNPKNQPLPDIKEIPCRWIAILSRKRSFFKFDGRIRYSFEIPGILSIYTLIAKWFKKCIIYYLIVLILYLVIAYGGFSILMTIIKGNLVAGSITAI